MASSETTKKIVMAGAVMNISAIAFISWRRQWKIMEREREELLMREKMKDALDKEDLQCFFGSRQYIMEQCHEVDTIHAKGEEVDTCMRLEKIMQKCKDKIYEQLPAVTACMKELPPEFRRS